MLLTMGAILRLRSAVFLCCFLSQQLLASSICLPQDSRPDVRVRLVAARGWSWQGDPIRCALEVLNRGADVQVRSKYSSKRSTLFPFEVEYEHDEGWQPVRPTKKRRSSHPARYITSPTGWPVKGNFAFEVELWDLDAVSRPGRIRLRFAIEVKDRAKEGAAWTELQTPWLTIEIRDHPANAACLLAEGTAALQAQYDALSATLNSTMQTARNTGPVNFGPAGPSSVSQRWRRCSLAVERLLADKQISKHLRSRARLAFAYESVEQAVHARDDDQLLKFLQTAREHLAAIEFDAQPASGGLEPLRRMLVAYVAGRLHQEDRQLAHAQICERYPFFGMMWRSELRQLLLR